MHRAKQTITGRNRQRGIRLGARGFRSFGGGEWFWKLCTKQPEEEREELVAKHLYERRSL